MEQFWVWLGQGFVVLALVVLLVWLWNVVSPRNRWAEQLPAPKSGSCQECVHWSLDEGRATLQRFPAFLQAASVLSANQMQRSAVDGIGEANEGRAQLPLAEDKWEYFGACLGHAELRHRTDTCSKFCRVRSWKARGVTPGEGFVKSSAGESDDPKVVWGQPLVDELRDADGP